MPKSKAAKRNIKLVEAPLLGGKGAKSLVMARDNAPDASMADDPEFERRAAEFERRLGVHCFNDPRANEVAAQMCGRIVRYLAARLRRIESTEARLERMRLIFTRLAGQGMFAGAVTQPDPTAKPGENLERLVTPVMGVLSNGNLRERMNVVDQFMHVLSEDFASTKLFDDLEEVAEEAGLDVAALRKRFVSGSGKRVLLDPAPERTTLAERDQVRVPTNDPKPFSGMTVRDMRLTPPTHRERSHMERSTGKEIGLDGRVTFTEGAKVFAINEAHPWVQRMRGLSLPLKAGPSGHTQLFMQANLYLGVGAPPEHVQLACIGHLVPINSHSLVEVLEVAQHHGCSFVAGPYLYRQLLPFSPEELRVIGGGRFPDEGSVEQMKKNIRAEQLAQIPALDDKALAIHLDRQQKVRAKALEEMGVTKGKEGPVTSFLKSKERAVLEEAITNPLKTPVQRHALRIADEHASSTEEEDVAAVKERIELALETLGADDPKGYPDAYERCVALLRDAPLTVNVFTTTILHVLHGGYLNRAERTQGTADTNRIFNPAYGNPEYAYSRDALERIMHGLPQMHPHFVPEDLQEGRNLARQALETGGKSGKNSLVSGVYAPKRPIVGLYGKKGPVIKVTSPEGDVTYPLEDIIGPREIARPATEYFRGREYLRTAPVERDPDQIFALPGDHPHSAALNVAHYRAGGAPSVAYGKSCLVFRDEVKRRCTFTGMDSKDYTFEGKAEQSGGPRKGLEMRAVASFDHLARALRYAHRDTFHFIVWTAVAPQGKKLKPPAVGPGMYFPYIEAQIFGEINLARDLAKIVIDEDDLELWESGKLKTDTLVLIKPRAKVEVKRELTAHADWLGVPIQFIRTGKNETDSGGAGAYLTEVEPRWEAYFERAISAMATRTWEAARHLTFPLAMLDAEPDVTTSTLWSYSSLGLGEMARLKDVARDFYEQAVVGDNGKMKLSASERAPEIVRIASLVRREYHLRGLALDRRYHEDLRDLCRQILYWLGKCMIQNWIFNEEEAREDAKERAKLVRTAPAWATRPTTGGGLAPVGLTGFVSPPPSKPSKPSRPEKKKDGPDVTARLRGPHERASALTVHETVGGGDCGIHAMFGQFDEGTGMIRHANQQAYRQRLHTSLTVDNERLHDRYIPMLSDLVREVVVVVETQGEQALTRDGRTFWRNLCALEGMRARLEGVYEDEQAEFRALGRIRALIIQSLMEFVVAGSEASAPLTAFLVREVLRSGAQSDQELRAVLVERSGDIGAQAAAVRAQAHTYLKKLVEANLDALVGRSGAIEALGATVHTHAGYQVRLGNVRGSFRPAVEEHIGAILAAYGESVAVAGYYLREEDLLTLADLEARGLTIYQVDDQDPTRYRVYREHQTQRVAGTIHVFHSGAHYERATLG